MGHENLRAVLRHAAAASARATDGAADGELLRRFARDRDEAAFAALVARHGRLVWAVCRNLLPADADAEDAFQATFLALVRSAGAVRDGGKLGPWLHGVAVRVCAKARRAAARRKAREAAGAAGPRAGPVVPDSAWDAALAAVHEEVARLPEALRAPLVLCCLEGRGVADAAARLGWKVGTVAGRLARAKRALLARLEARGLGAAAVAAAAVACGSAAAGVPAALAGRAAGLSNPGMAVSCTVLHLSQGVVGMSVHRTKLLAAAVLLAGGLSSVAGAGLLAGPQPPTPSTEPAAPTTRPPAADPLPSLDPPSAEPLPSPYRPAGEKPPAPVPGAETLTAPSPDPAPPAAQAGVPAAESGPARRWQYDFQPARPLEADKFVEVLRGREARGWEFVGQVTLRSGGKDAPHWAFRRPPQPPELRPSTFQPAAAPAGVELSPTPVQAPVLEPTPRLPDVTLRPPEPIYPVVPAPGRPEDRAGDQEDRIRKLEAELKSLRELLRSREDSVMPRQEVLIPAKEVGLPPGEMMEVLAKLADGRFGPDARKRLEMTADSKGLTVRGDAEAVRWARDLVKQVGSR